MKPEIHNLHQKAIDIAKRFHQAESELINILQQIDDHKVFLKLGYPSLFDYSLKALKLSEANASNFITVARKSKFIPELKQAIDQGKITVSKARKITPVLTQENKEHWIALAQELPKQKLEKEIAKALPQQAVQERAQYITGDRVKLTVGISEDLLKLLKRVQDLEFQRTSKPANYEESIAAALKLYINKLDPVERAKRCIKSIESVEKINDTQASVPGHIRMPLPQQLKHQIFLRDQGRCTHKDAQNNRCTNSRWIELHHKTPVRAGGTNHLNNLATLCSEHHKIQHLD